MVDPVSRVAVAPPGTGTTGQQIFHHNVWFRELVTTTAWYGRSSPVCPGSTST